MHGAGGGGFSGSFGVCLASREEGGGVASGQNDSAFSPSCRVQRGFVLLSRSPPPPHTHPPVRPPARPPPTHWEKRQRDRRPATEPPASSQQTCRMLSTAVTISHMEPSSQEGGEEEAEASAPLNPHPDGEVSRRRGGGGRSCWYRFRKPILAILIGALLFGTGTALSLLYFTQVGNVPYLLGPLFLSVGLMFLVTGLVWVPVVKQSLEHKALTKVNHGKGSHGEHHQRH